MADLEIALVPHPSIQIRRLGIIRTKGPDVAEDLLFADMQARTGRENGHFLDWALGNSTDFYKLSARLLPLQVTGEDGGPVITRVELVAPSAEDIERARERGS